MMNMPFGQQPPQQEPQQGIVGGTFETMSEEQEKQAGGFEGLSDGGPSKTQVGLGGVAKAFGGAAQQSAGNPYDSFHRLYGGAGGGVQGPPAPQMARPQPMPMMSPMQIPSFQPPPMVAMSDRRTKRDIRAASRDLRAFLDEIGKGVS